MVREFVAVVAGPLLALATSAAVVPASAAPHSPSAASRRAALDAEMGNDLAHIDLYGSLESPQYTACMDKTGGTTILMRDCSKAEYERLDRLLNATYQRKMASLPPARRAALRASERTWLQRREPYCARYFTPGGGTAELLSFDTCLLDTTIHRTRFIRRFR